MAKRAQSLKVLDPESVKVRTGAIMLVHGITKEESVLGGNGAEILNGGEFTDGDSTIYILPELYNRIKSEMQAIEMERTIRMSFYVVLAACDTLPDVTAVVDGYRLAV